MTADEVVRERILAISAVTALVSSRVWTLKLPQQPTLPAVRVQGIGQGQFPHLRGSGGPKRTRVQVDAYAAEASGVDPFAQVNAVADAICGDGSGNGLDGWTGYDGGSPVSVHVTGVLLVDRAPSYEAEEFRLVRVRMDFLVWWRPVSAD